MNFALHADSKKEITGNFHLKFIMLIKNKLKYGTAQVDLWKN